MPNPLTAQQVIKYVRSHTTGSEADIPDDQILYFAGLGADVSNADNVLTDGSIDLAGVIADSWEYIGRDIRYGSEQHGPVAVSQPVALGMAALWRARSHKGGHVVTLGRLRRTDVAAWPPPTDDEFSV